MKSNVMTQWQALSTSENKHKWPQKIGCKQKEEAVSERQGKDFLRMDNTSQLSLGELHSNDPLYSRLTGINNSNTLYSSKSLQEVLDASLQRNDKHLR